MGGDARTNDFGQGANQEATAESGGAAQDDEGLQEKLGQRLEAAQKNLGKDLGAALEMVKERLRSTRLLEKELSQLRQEKQQLVAQLATIGRNCGSSKLAAAGATPMEPASIMESACESEGTPEGSPEGSNVGSMCPSDSELELPGSFQMAAARNSIGAGGRKSLLGAFSSATQLGQDLFSTAAGKARLSFSGAATPVLSMADAAPVLPSAPEPPEPPHAEEPPMSPVTSLGSKDNQASPTPQMICLSLPGGLMPPKSALKTGGSQAGSRRTSAVSAASDPDGRCPPPKSVSGGRASISIPERDGTRRTSAVRISIQPGVLVEPGQAAPKSKPRTSKLMLGGEVIAIEDVGNDRKSKIEEGDYESQSNRGSLPYCVSGLESEDCDEFFLLDRWMGKGDDMSNAGDAKEGKLNKKMSQMMFDYSTLANGELMTLRDRDDEERNCCLEFFLKLIVHPNALRRTAWDLSSFVLLAYDMITLPLLSAFDPKQTDFLFVMVWITRIFWTMDVVASCSTGYMRTDGAVEMRPVLIWKRYMRTWFLLDLALIGIDWIEMYQSLDSTVDFARFGKASRGFRILRLLRLLRLIRFGQLVQIIDERIRSDRLMIFADIVKIVLLILLFSHFSACAWYGIGTAGTGETWVKAHLQESPPIPLSYLISLHWSLSQLDGGMSEIVPHNLLERVYSVVLFLIAFMMAAVLVSSLTSEITRLQIISNTHAQQMSILRRFLTDNNVSTKLAVRVQRNARHALQEQQRHIQESNVELLQMVSEPLRMELHFEMQAPLLSKHPFFYGYIEECPHIMRKVCHKCTKMTACFLGDVIFNPGEVPRPPKMYFVANGSFEYLLMSGRQVAVREGSWLAEPVVWTSWSHKGGLRAKGDSHLCELMAETFQQVCLEFDHSNFDPVNYGINFVELLNAYDGNLSDLPLPLERLEEAVDCGRAQSLRSFGSNMFRRPSGGRLRSSGGLLRQSRRS